MNLYQSFSVTHTIWVDSPKPNPGARVRLFCFPYAGAGSSTYRSWSGLLPPEVELYLIHLPGRDKRIREPLLLRMPPLIEALGGSIASYLDKPFLFFGHSMGALVSFELARYLRSHYHQLPAHLFLSARCAPQVVDPNADIYLLPQHSFLEAVEDLYGALPDIVKEDPEVLELFLSILRADLTVLGTYAYVHEPPLDCPISVYAGSHDHSVSEANLEAWRKQTSAAFDLRIFPGSHSFIQNSRAGIINDIHRHLSSYLNY